MIEEAVSQSSSSSSAPTLWASINSWFTPTVFFVVLQFVIATIYITSNIANNTNTNTNTNKKQQPNHQHNQRQQNSQEDDKQQQQQVARSPSQRLKSINFNSYTYRSQEPRLEVHNAPQEEELNSQAQIPRSPTVLQRLKSINLHNFFPNTDESEKQHHSDNDEITETHETATVESDEEKEEDKGEDEDAEPSLDDVYSQILQGQGRHFNRSRSDTTAASGQVPVKLPGKSASTKSAVTHFKEDDIFAVENRRPASVREGKVSGGVEGGGDDGGVDAKADDFINKFKQQLKLQRFDSTAK